MQIGEKTFEMAGSAGKHPSREAVMRMEIAEKTFKIDLTGIGVSLVLAIIVVAMMWKEWLSNGHPPLC